MRRFSAVLVCLLLGIGAVAQNSARMEAMRLIREGDNYLRMGQWNEALVFFNNAVNADPGFADAFMKRAALNKRMGYETEAYADFNRALAINPYSTYIYDQRFKIELLAIEYFAPADERTLAENTSPIQMDHESDDLINTGAYNEALLVIDSLIALGYEREYEFEKKALIYFLQEDYARCEQFIDSALAISPASALPYDLRGLSQMRRGEINQALASFSLAIEKDPSFSLAFLNRAVAHLRNGDQDAALKDLRVSIELNQEIALSHYLQGTILSQKGEIRKSLDAYNAALDLDDTNTKALFNRSFTWKMMGDFTRAMEDAAIIVELNPESAEFWNLKGNMHTLYTDYYDAIDCYDRAIDLKPDYGEAYFNRGLAYLMSYAPIQGCDDLQESRRHGYARAEKAITHFCAP
ncbi:MAG TPA: hypothetical protein DCE81_11405 [Cytophagales bacterium]|nr:hypothetical protein [Cytophagales bacterium]